MVVDHLFAFEKTIESLARSGVNTIKKWCIVRFGL